jgi:hypothetical protein
MAYGEKEVSQPKGLFFRGKNDLGKKKGHTLRAYFPITVTSDLM